MVLPEHQKIIELLKPQLPFQSISTAEWEQLLVSLEPRQFKAGETIIEDGEEGADVYIIITGICCLFKRNMAIKPYQRGEYFGEFALLDERKRNGTVRAETDVVLYTLSADVLFDHEKITSVLSGKIIKGFAQQLSAYLRDGVSIYRNMDILIVQDEGCELADNPVTSYLPEQLTKAGYCVFFGKTGTPYSDKKDYLCLVYNLDLYEQIKHIPKVVLALTSQKKKRIEAEQFDFTVDFLQAVGSWDENDLMGRSESGDSKDASSLFDLDDVDSSDDRGESSAGDLRTTHDSAANSDSFDGAAQTAADLLQADEATEAGFGDDSQTNTRAEERSSGPETGEAGQERGVEEESAANLAAGDERSEASSDTIDPSTLQATESGNALEAGEPSDGSQGHREDGEEGVHIPPDTTEAEMAEEADQLGVSDSTSAQKESNDDEGRDATANNGGDETQSVSAFDGDNASGRAEDDEGDGKHHDTEDAASGGESSGRSSAVSDESSNAVHLEQVDSGLSAASGATNMIDESGVEAANSELDDATKDSAVDQEGESDNLSGGASDTAQDSVNPDGSQVGLVVDSHAPADSLQTADDAASDTLINTSSNEDSLASGDAGDVEAGDGSSGVGADLSGGTTDLDKEDFSHDDQLVVDASQAEQSTDLPVGSQQDGDSTGLTGSGDSTHHDGQLSSDEVDSSLDGSDATGGDNSASGLREEDSTASSEASHQHENASGYDDGGRLATELADPNTQQGHNRGLVDTDTGDKGQQGGLREDRGSRRRPRLDGDWRNRDARRKNLFDYDLSQMDFSGTDLRYANLHHADLRGSVFNNTLFDDAILAETDFQYLDVQGLSFEDADFSGIRARGTNFSNTELCAVNFYRADLSGADVTAANLRQADLREVNFTNAILQNAKLESAVVQLAKGLQSANLAGVSLADTGMIELDLRGVDLQTARLKDVRFTRTIFDRSTKWPKGFSVSTTRGLFEIGPNRNWEGKNFIRLQSQGADLSNSNLLHTNLSLADLRGVSLSGSNLMGADLDEAKLQGAVLDNCNLSEASIQYVDLRGLDLSTCTVKDVVWTGSTFDDTTKWPSDFENPAALGLIKITEDGDYQQMNLANVSMRGAVLHQAKFVGSDLRGIDLHGASLKAVDCSGADMREAELTDCHLQNVHFQGCLFSRCSLVGATLENMNLMTLDLRYAKLFNVLFVDCLYDSQTKWPEHFAAEYIDGLICVEPGSSLQRKSLTGVDFQSRNLQQVSFAYADLRDADLSNCNLANSDFTGSDIRGANLRGANLQGANLQDVIKDERTIL